MPHTLGKPSNASGKKGRGVHENDIDEWPNEIGFEVFHEERTPIKLTVKGKIPEYACGVLYRTGPGGARIETSKGTTYTAQHWFDGFAQVHRFQILSPTCVLYNSRHTSDALVNYIRTTGRIPPGSFSFAQKRDPCQSFWSKLISIWKPTAPSSLLGNPAAANVGVTITPNCPGLPTTNKDEGAEITNLYNKTDANIFQGLDPETLEPVGIVRQTKLHPDLSGQLSCAHSQVCPKTGEVFNYNLDISRISVYRVFRISAVTGETDILATISDAPPAYIHSFFLTESYVILCIMSSRFAIGGVKILYHRNIVDALEDVTADKKAIWYVIPRDCAAHRKVRKFEGMPFFAFHSVNAWEEASGDVVAEIPVFPNIDILKKFYLNRLISSAPDAAAWKCKGRPRFTRFRIPLSETSARNVETLWSAGEDESMELPTINHKYRLRAHRYTYGIADRGQGTFADGLVKYDSVARSAKLWCVLGHTPGEAIFVPDPDGVEEDDGVLLSVVLDGWKGTSYLVVLDSKSMVELGRAEMSTAFPFGFHGNFTGRPKVDLGFDN